MSKETAVSTHELELESAELLPSRETLCVPKYHPAHSSNFTVTQADGNTVQYGIINIAIGNGILDSIF